MHVQAANSVLWIAALYPELTNAQFARLWQPYASVAGYLADFAREHLPPRPDVPAPERPKAGLLGKLFGRG